MRSSFTAIGAGAALLLSGCDKKQESATLSPLVAPVSPGSASYSTLPELRAATPHPRTVGSVSNISATVDRISEAQKSLFLKSGDWLTQEAIYAHELAVWQVVSREILGQEYVHRGDSGRAVAGALNEAGYHLYLSLMEVKGREYFSAVLFALGEPKTSRELDDVKRMMKLSDAPTKMRQLKQVCATQHSESIYGTVGGDGNIFVDPWLIQRDKLAGERDPMAMFKVVLANELAHSKLLDAKKSGAVPKTENAIDEAFSDCWSLVITPDRECLYSVMDVLSSTTPRYYQSKRCVQAGLEAYGKKYVAGFIGVGDDRSIERLVAQVNGAAKTDSLRALKIEILRSYRNTLMSHGLPETLFEVGL